MAYAFAGSKTTFLPANICLSLKLEAANDAIVVGLAKAIADKPIRTTGTDWSKIGIETVADKSFISTFGGYFVERGDFP